MQFNGKNPTIMYGYGGFGISETPYYSGICGKLWCENGTCFVVANIRGGGEYGPKWHQAGIKEKRINAHDDFISVAEDLIARQITSAECLGIYGASNGGLLTGAVFTRRPDLFKGVVSAAPLLDMLNYHTMLTGASVRAEYGDPADNEMRAVFKKYSPYHNVFRNKHYPEVLFMSSTKDDRVHPGHARKMVDKMLSQGHKVHYYENTEGGHEQASNLKQKAFYWSLVYNYMKEQLVPKKPQPTQENRCKC